MPQFKLELVSVADKYVTCGLNLDYYKTCGKPAMWAVYSINDGHYYWRCDEHKEIVSIIGPKLTGDYTDKVPSQVPLTD